MARRAGRCVYNLGPRSSRILEKEAVRRTSLPRSCKLRRVTCDARKVPKLPDDVWRRVLTFAGAGTTRKFREISKNFYALTNDDSLWREIWYKHHHHEFYKREVIDRGLQDRLQLMMRPELITPIAMVLASRRIEWGSWEEKVSFRSGLRICRSGLGGRGCGRWFHGESGGGRLYSSEGSSRCNVCRIASIMNLRRLNIVLLACRMRVAAWDLPLFTN